MAVLQFTGTIISITPEIDKKGFKARYVRVKEPNYTDDKYSNKYNVQVPTNKYGIIDKFKAGSIVTVHANCRGNEYTKDGVPEYATNLVLWKMELAGADTQSFNQQDQQRAENVGFAQTPSESGSDVPF